ncbi:MAG: hypothetical protein VR78_17810 [Hoeflea sp. BRH_c9]|nr:MAG: hypothetical protein VR78_17810 [Hoeflea sp. BRH_c9]
MTAEKLWSAGFQAWRALDPVIHMSRKLGFDMSQCYSWQSFRSEFIRVNDQDVGHLVQAARRIEGVLSTGELPVLLAMLHAADFSWLADELADGQTWRMMDRTHGPHATAVALAIMQQ